MKRLHQLLSAVVKADWSQIIVVIKPYGLIMIADQDLTLDKNILSRFNDKITSFQIEKKDAKGNWKKCGKRIT
ncbi:hypothetical protein VB265_20570 [Enterobacter sichuanensis]|uniref:hypothetical protein n=1 Tax=Enterobacter TaxID=547 RepID=UPI00064D17D3|nr:MULTISPECIES: hypothetical protein [Enterobacter]KLW92408.1 hypothetical protein SP99_02630 [Enterobacter sp. BIDMC92]MEA5171894.1 hypothetical protein [Enterobacter sichuanensis]